MSERKYDGKARASTSEGVSRARGNRSANDEYAGRQPYGRAPRRPLTSAERRYILKQRKRKARRKRVLIALFALLAVAGAVVLHFFMTDGWIFAPAAQPTPINQITLTNAPHASPTEDAQLATNKPTQFSSTFPDDMLEGLPETTENFKQYEGSITVTDLSVNEALDPDWYNVLLLGIDTRNELEVARSDTMIICSINIHTGNVKLTSIMRDMAVDIGEHGLKRINSAYFYGGPKLAMKLVNECFGMNIRHYVSVGFDSFSVIAEALGGTYMNITEAEMNEINTNVIEAYKLAIKKGQYEYSVAEQEYYDTMLKEYGANIKLNGMQTLGYARIRKLAGGDYERARRQRQVLNALMNNIRQSDAGTLFSLAVRCIPYISTNIPSSDIVKYASLVLNRETFTNTGEFRLPVNDSYKEETRNNESMLYDTDFETNALKLKSFIYFEN